MASNLLIVMSFMIAVTGQARADPCHNISAKACETIVLPGIKATLGSDLANYDLTTMWFTDFGCEKVSPLKLKPGKVIRTLHLFYDACKHRMRVDRSPIL